VRAIVVTAASILLGGSAAPDTAGVAEAVAAADAHYARRDEGPRGGTADPREIADAIAAYSSAAGRAPEDASVRWKLARALYFQGTYTGLDAKGQRDAFARGKAAAEEALAILKRRRALSKENPDAAPSLFWAAVDWGQWGLATNKVDAATNGVARRVRDYCLALIELDPSFEEGGGYRILGRLHDSAPKIPLVTGWVSRAEGIRNLELAVGVAPENLVNLQFLAEAKARAGDVAKARALEERVVAGTPSPDHLVEELAIQETARANLARWAPAGK
jgi:hypothetical protein